MSDQPFRFLHASDFHLDEPLTGIREILAGHVEGDIVELTVLHGDGICLRLSVPGLADRSPPGG